MDFGQFKEEIISAIQKATMQASSDLYKQSKGKILYECGAEPILVAYAAREIQKALVSDESAYLEMEYKTRDLMKERLHSETFRKGRIDLYASANDEQYQAIVEFKRYLSVGYEQRDLVRMAEIVSIFEESGIKTVGILATVMYQHHSNPYSYLGEYKNRIQNICRSFTDVDLEVVELARENLPMIKSKRYDFKRDQHFSVIVKIEARV